ncbi:hypothetical protein Mapa_014328 [Marchantia paleacea]|nr:hypothetical protein Mapa_014328 [Marchantia paleacea]
MSWPCLETPITKFRAHTTHGIILGASVQQKVNVMSPTYVWLWIAWSSRTRCWMTPCINTLHELK